MSALQCFEAGRQMAFGKPAAGVTHAKTEYRFINIRSSLL